MSAFMGASDSNQVNPGISALETADAVQVNPDRGPVAEHLELVAGQGFPRLSLSLHQMLLQMLAQVALALLFHLPGRKYDGNGLGERHANAVGADPMVALLLPPLQDFENLTVTVQFCVRHFSDVCHSATRLRQNVNAVNKNF